MHENTFNNTQLKKKKNKKSNLMNRSLKLGKYTLPCHLEKETNASFSNWITILQRKIKKKNKTDAS